MPTLYDITPFTLLDFPNTPAAIFWFAGCNFRCLYCYNPHIVFAHAKITQQEALGFLKKRQGLLEGVVLSGGEATLYPHLEAFATKIKELGFAIKLDTNASRPEVIRRLLEASLLDYVALDYKAPQNRIADLCGVQTQERLFWDTFALLKQSGVDFEVRTTYHSSLISKEELFAMRDKLQSAGYTKSFYIQLVRPQTPTIGDIKEDSMVDFRWIEEFGVVRI